MLEEDIELIKKWLDLFEHMENEFYKKSKNLSEKWDFLSSLTTKKRLKKIDTKIVEYDIKRDSIRNWKRTISWIYNSVKRSFPLYYDFTVVYYIITKESYENNLNNTKKAHQKASNILRKIEYLCVQIYDLLNTDGRIEEEQENEINDKLEIFLEKLEETAEDVKINYTFEKVEVEFTNTIDCKLALNVLTEYTGLSDILVASIKKGYDYETYYQLAFTFNQIQEWNNEALNMMEENHEKDLENNMLYVIDHNLCNKEVISLYEKKDLLEYRGILLEKMLRRKELSEVEEKESILKLERITEHILYKKQE